MPDTKVTHHEPPTCPAFLLAQQLYAALWTAAEVLDTYSDEDDGDDGQPVANRAMSALREVEAAIAAAEGTAA